MTQVGTEHFLFLEGVPEELKLRNVPNNDAWTNNNSTFANYCESSGIPEAEKIIKNQIGHFAIKTALDIAGGSDGVALQNLLDDATITEGLVTNYYDSRGSQAKKTEALTHISGDILQPPTWREIKDWQTTHSPEGFSLILHRPYGALQDLPAAFYEGATHTLIDMLRPEGVLLVQIPSTLQKWFGGNIDSVCSSLRQRDDIESIRTPELILPLSSALIIKRS